ncbi:hypothetical protein HY632_04870 [Candidatus Uhrbacteria bacterium]|nr:hypothetical protein [Candidatus Uhrbacteria bacterium]
MRRVWEYAERVLQAYATFVQKKVLDVLMRAMLMVGVSFPVLYIYAVQGLVHPVVLRHAFAVFAAITCFALVGCVAPLMLSDGIEAWHRYWRRESRDARRARLVRWRGWSASVWGVLVPGAPLGGVFGALLAVLLQGIWHGAFRGAACGLLGALLGGGVGCGVRWWLVRAFDRRIATHDDGTAFLTRLRKRLRTYPLSLSEEFPLNLSMLHESVLHPPVVPNPEDPTDNE